MCLVTINTINTRCVVCVTVSSINFDFTFDDAMATAFGCTVKCFDPRSLSLCLMFVCFSQCVSVCLPLSICLVSLHVAKLKFK